MTRHNNILSFDEARARGAVSSRSGAKQAPKSPPIAHKNAAHSSQMRRSASQVNPQRPVPNQARQNSAYAASSRPERLTYDPSFVQSFTATSRSGSYQNARRGERSVHPSYATNMPPRHPSASHVGRTSATAHSAVRSGDPYARQNAMGAQDAHRTDPHANADHKDKKKSLAHRVRSAKAERQFNKTFGTDEPVKPGPDQSSRPALYEMKMGKNHKRSARMQSSATSKKKRGFFARFVSLFAFLDPRSPRFSSQALIACATFVLAAVMLYQPVANYYQEVRSQQQLEAEYAVVSDYYSSLKSEVEYLNTKEGLEEYVREELGWVKSGEQVSSVEGLAPRDSTAKQGSITADLSNAVPTPVTWYSPVLDFVFGYNKP